MEWHGLKYSTSNDVVGLLVHTIFKDQRKVKHAIVCQSEIEGKHGQVWMANQTCISGFAMQRDKGVLEMQCYIGMALMTHSGKSATKKPLGFC